MLLKKGILWESTCQIPLCGRQIVKWVTWNYSWRNAFSKEFCSQLWEILLLVSYLSSGMLTSVFKPPRSPVVKRHMQTVEQSKLCLLSILGN